MDFNSALQPEDQTKVNEWIRFGLRLSVSASIHPLEYAKVLMQLGYEPIQPRAGKTLLGQPALVLPNIFQYVSYIKKVDGFTGCYRGVTPKILGILVGTIGSEKIAVKLGFNATDDDGMDESDITDEELYRRFEKRLKRNIILHISGIVISQPFQVITMRMMAQFIGRESTYKSIYSAIKEIWTEEGVFGFFSGLIPKLLGDLSCLLLASSTTYMISKYLIRDRDSRQYAGTFMQFISSNLLYPFQVVSACMSVTGSRLQAGRPPQMLIYGNWTQCWNDLSAIGELKRGNSLFWRYYRPMPSLYKLYPPLPQIAKY